MSEVEAENNEVVSEEASLQPETTTLPYRERYYLKYREGKLDSMVKKSEEKGYESTPYKDR